MDTAQVLDTLNRDPQRILACSGNEHIPGWSYQGISVQRCIFAEKMGIISSPHAGSTVFLIFGIKGNFRISYLHGKEVHSSTAGSHNFLHAANGSLQFTSETGHLEIVSVGFSADLFLQTAGNGGELLRRLATAVKAGNNALLNDQWGINDMTINQVVGEIDRCPHLGELKNLYLTAKCLELLVLCATACCYARKQKAVYLKTQTDKEKIMEVRKLLETHIHQPPRLNEIAKTVGLNVFKLKSGFKEVYKMSIFHYLTQQRLRIAHQYLKETDFTAAEIAYKLGYATPQHFSYMFKKNYGYTPHQVKASYKDIASVLIPVAH